MNPTIGGVVVILLFAAFVALVAFIAFAVDRRAKHRRTLYDAAEKYLKS